MSADINRYEEYDVHQMQNNHRFLEAFETGSSKGFSSLALAKRFSYEFSSANFNDSFWAF